MEIELRNIGIIKDSTIKIDGLTVITGPNNSGKTTVGKVLYSIINSVENIEANVLKDKTKFAMETIYNILDRYGLFMILRRYMPNDGQLPKSIKLAIMGRNIKINNLFELISYVQNLQEDIEQLNLRQLIESQQDSEEKLLYNKRIFERVKFVSDNQQKIIKELDKLIKILKSDEKFIGYSNAKMFNYLNKEMNSQIPPVKNFEGNRSSIVVKSKNSIYYDIEINNNEINNKESFFLNAFSKCIYVDDIRVIDGLSNYKRLNETHFRNRFRDEEFFYDSFLNSIDVKSHDEALSDELIKPISEFEQTTYKKKAEEVFKKLDETFCDDITFVDGKYVCYHDKLDIRNLASGSKMFLILKLLLEKGALDENSLLILDEPENHLHPEWLNILAEVIVLMEKQLKIKVLVTTHSPNLLLALETMTKKYNLTKVSNYYVSQKLEDKYMVQILNVNDNVEVAYEHLAMPYLKMDNLRYDIDELKLDEQNGNRHTKDNKIL